MLKAQSPFLISGKGIDSTTHQPLQSATVHLLGYAGSTLTRQDGSFSIQTNVWYDSLEITIVGYEPVKVLLRQGHSAGLLILMKNAAAGLQSVTVSIGKRPGKTLMEKVIENKPDNDPERFHSYSYQRYSRNELDLDNVDYKKMKGKGLKGLVASVYSGLDSDSRLDKSLPIYFSETLADNYHSLSPRFEKEDILAKKSLGLKTDDLLRHLERFYFFFSVYDNWIPVFNQTYVSPLNDKAFAYYNFFLGDTIAENGIRLRQVRFVPIQAYERSFVGTLWINDSTYAVESVDMHLTKTANMNFVTDINYSEEYKQVVDSSTGKWVYMPYRYSSEVKFEAGLALLGIPVPENKQSVHLITRSSTVLDKLVLGGSTPEAVLGNIMAHKTPSGLEKPENYWIKHRPDSLTPHERNIYRMVDSLKENDRFQREIKLIAFAGSGYWDFGDKLRIGPYTSFVSHNPLEGFRVRIGFWTLSGISNHLNVYGYGAYGTKDRQFKGGLGVKYVWNEKKWTKTSLWGGSDYDYIIDQHEELDKDNVVSSFLRKPVPFTHTYVKKLVLSHEQYLSHDWSLLADVGYRELDPVFDFSYNPISPLKDKPIDSISLKVLPVAETSVGLRYAHKERTTIVNYDQLHLGSFSPIVTFKLTQGFEFRRTFDYTKMALSVEQKLRLPPKSMLYYKLNAGKIFGTIPYLLLDIPAGNEFHASSRNEFNTMIPYEFAADRYVGLHTRLSLGGAIFDHIPFLQRLGWRETVSFNAYWGDMTQKNMYYNRKSNFNLIGNQPFMEGAVGIDNIFHMVSIDYYRRFTHLGNPYAKKDGIYLGIHFTF
ncbi:MAG: DUF5686 family protein [Bacteroidota bacterium]|nr:DUF5686 family protein [Bacteroidota bacterium]